MTDMLRKDYKADINVEQVAVSIFGGVKLKGILIRDHHKLTMITAKSIKTNILSFEKLYNGDLLFGEIRIDSLFFNLTTYKGEKDTNLDKFVAAFDDNPPKPSSGKFRLKINSISLQNSRFRYIDQNLNKPKIIDFSSLNGQLDDFYVKGANVFAYVYKMSFKDHRGLIMKNLTSSF